MNRRAQGGFVLVATLLIIVIFLVTGLGILSAQATRYASAARLVEGVQAKNAALSALEDVRVKLAKDVQFPPRRKGEEPAQFKFAYSEQLYPQPGDPPLADPNQQVSYTVVVDFGLVRQYQVMPKDPDKAEWLPYRWGVYRITASGFVGPREDPVAQAMVYAEYDIDTGKFIRFDDRSSL